MEVVASLSQSRTAAAQCGLFTHKSVPIIFEPPCISLHRREPYTVVSLTTRQIPCSNITISVDGLYQFIVSKHNAMSFVKIIPSPDTQPLCHIRRQCVCLEFISKLGPDVQGSPDKR